MTRVSCSCIAYSCRFDFSWLSLASVSAAPSIYLSGCVVCDMCFHLLASHISLCFQSMSSVDRLCHLWHTRRTLHKLIASKYENTCRRMSSCKYMKIFNKNACSNHKWIGYYNSTTRCTVPFEPIETYRYIPHQHSTSRSIMQAHSCLAQLKNWDEK